METSLFFTLLLLVQYSSCERFNIVPSPGSPCPGEFTGEPCLTLEQYVANFSLSSDITLEVHPGNHRLDPRLPAVRLINSFTMRANASATVTCNEQLSDPLYFYRMQQVHISGITFVGCRMWLRYITNVTFERNSFTNRTRCCFVGAAFMILDSSLLIRQCIISNTRPYTGAIYGYQSTFRIEQTTFRDNYFPTTECCYHRGEYGRALHLSNVNIEIVDSHFINNSASYGGHGGAIYTYNGEVTITGTYFSNNRAGSIGGHGGVIYFNGSNITITNSTFTNNQAGGDGGVLYIGRAGSHVTVNEATFSHNTATSRGGIISITGSTLKINRASILGNTAGQGEVVSACNSDIIFTNPAVLASQNPIYLSCLYNNSNILSISHPMEQNAPVACTTADSLTGPGITNEGDAPNDLTTTPPDAIIPTVTEIMTTEHVVEIIPLGDPSKTNHSGSDDGKVQGTAEYNLHIIVPGYVAVAVLLVLISFIGLIVIVKMLRAKTKSKGVRLRHIYDRPS